MQKFFLTLDSRVQALQRLTAQMPDSGRNKWDSAVAEVEEQVEELQHQAQKTGTVLLVSLQVGTTCHRNFRLDTRDLYTNVKSALICLFRTPGIHFVAVKKGSFYI